MASFAGALREDFENNRARAEELAAAEKLVPEDPADRYAMSSGVAWPA